MREIDNIKDKVREYMNDNYLVGDELFEKIANNDRCIHVIESAMPSYSKAKEHEDMDNMENIVDMTARKVMSIFYNKNGKRYIYYQGQAKVVSNLNEAIDFINTLINYKVCNYPIKANDLCIKRLEKVFNGEWDGVQKIHAYNTGGNPILISPALGDSVEEHLDVLKKWREDDGCNERG